MLQAAARGVTALGLDRWSKRNGPPAASARSAVQGNLDPLALIAGGRALEEAMRIAILLGFEGRPHIFNLGHGVLPETPISNVERLVARLRQV